MRPAALLLALGASPSSALQLGATPLPPKTVSVRPALTARMQVPEAATDAAATDAADFKGSIVPKSTTPVDSDVFKNLVAGKPELELVFRRAEFWANETVTLVEVINVLGRFEQAAQFKERTQFSAEDLNPKEEDERQAETLKRYEMAQRMGCSERCAFYLNIPNLPFSNAKLAASVGKTVEDFEGLAVTKSACNLVYDALAESRSGLIPYDTLTKRRAAFLTEDGAFNEVAFRTGLYKSRGLIIAAWFMFGKGNFLWVLVWVKLLHDWRPDLIPSPVDMGLFKIGTFI